DTELIMEIMDNAPEFWAQIIDTERMQTLEQLQDSIKYHEERLEHGGYSDSRMDELEKLVPNHASTNLVGFHVTIGTPQFPKDDANVSPKGRTPASKGARPCRHCGSDKHWDNECRHSKKAHKVKRANGNYASQDPEYLKAQDAYDDLYY
ncbi:hypothetical protein M408DRAFT_34453, partial [Serendipita vermifera MAFF 305830]